MDEVKRSFAPVIDPGVRVLVLGSLPGEQSLAQQRYYGNPRNAFWRLIGAVIGVDLIPLDYDARLKALLASGVGLWDAVGSATRRGSLDGAIKNHVPNDLRSIAHNLPELKAVAFNGGRSAAIGSAQFAGMAALELIPLPSSSPAFTMSYDQKLERWLKIRSFL
jgi:hypoxanthine-DNA glycosylase